MLLIWVCILGQFHHVLIKLFFESHKAMLPTLAWCLFKASFLQKSVVFSHGYTFSQLNWSFSKTVVTVSLVINSLRIPEVCDLVWLIHAAALGLVLLGLCLQLSATSLATPQVTLTPEVGAEPLPLGLFV